MGQLKCLKLGRARRAPSSSRFDARGARPGHNILQVHSQVCLGTVSVRKYVEFIEFEFTHLLRTSNIDNNMAVQVISNVTNQT